MNIDKAIKLLIIERNCVRHADVCNRECDKCKLVQDTDELLEMYDDVVKNLEKLKEYEGLEEQGRFIKLSCKVGDTIWYVNEDDDEYPIELEIDTISREDNKDTWYCVNDDVYGKFEFIDSDFGETVFLTESEAEAKLKELRGNNE